MVKSDNIQLVAREGGWALEQDERDGGDGIRIRVALTGLCRTDIQAMRGQRVVEEGRVLGHEGAGWVEYVPAKYMGTLADRKISVGDRVAFFPFLPCGQCRACYDNHIEHCEHLQSVGLDVDGALSGRLWLPPDVLFKAPASLDWKSLAYAEPVCAALSVLEVEAVHSAKRVGVVGRGRIANLTVRVLASAGIVSEILDPHENWSDFDLLVETWPQAHIIEKCVKALRPGGTLVIKSRPPGTVAWPHQLITMRRLHLVGASYGRFDQALDLMARGQLEIQDMLGPAFALTQQGVEEALALEDSGETHGKLFFKIAPELSDLD